jgi:hypothetical protein
MTDLTEEENGSFHAKYKGKSAVFHAPKHKDIATVEDLEAIRHLLEPTVETIEIPPQAKVQQLLVVIDHQSAKIYRTELHGATPVILVPYDPHGFRLHLHSRIEATDGKRQPERKSFYEAVAKTLEVADRILLFGCGTGESNAMDQFIEELHHYHPDVAKRIIGAVVIDSHHQTEPELLARASKFFALKNV